MSAQSIEKSSVINDKKLYELISMNGYAIAGTVGKTVLKKLEQLYRKYHTANNTGVGVFQSLYSNDLEYRRKIHDELHAILEPVYKKLFTNYKITVNVFIIKHLNNKSEFALHQDTTGLDESLYCPLNIWIPLQNTGISNGCLCVVPHSHKIAFPYRGISIKNSFEKIENTIRKYLYPVEMKAGEILIFDNRLLHYSPPNYSGKPRVVVMSGVFPARASMLTCFQAPGETAIEVYEQPDDYLLKWTSFKSDIIERPQVKKVNEVNIQVPEYTEEDFAGFAQKYSMKKYEISRLQQDWSEEQAIEYTPFLKKIVNAIMRRSKHV